MAVALSTTSHGAACPQPAMSDAPPVSTIELSDWRASLPVLRGESVVLRDLRPSDASSLLGALATEEVARFISSPPTTVAGFERFIVWANASRAAGEYVCFAVVPRGFDAAVGIIQLRRLDAGSGVAEWGFALGQSFWGKGIFAEAAALVLEFAFETIGLHRLEARAAVENGRGNRALQNMGAHCDGRLRQSFSQQGRYLDQHLWSILPEDWHQRKAVGSGRLSLDQQPSASAVN